MSRAPWTSLLLLVCTAGMALGSPLNLISVPSTDTQPVGTYRLDVDSISVIGTTDKYVNDLGSTGLSYGVCRGLDVGVEVLWGVDHPFFVHAKYAFPLSSESEAFKMAVGGYALGLDNAPTHDIWYGVVSYAFGADRLHLGYFTGNDNTLRDLLAGTDESSGLLLGWDRTLGERWWVGVDYMAGKSTQGALNVGVRYDISPDSSLLCGFDFWNHDGIADTVNLQYQLSFR